MMQRTLGEFAAIADGRLAGADLPFAAVGTDTRTLAEGSVFVALSGPNHDGHDYVTAAIERGAVGAVVARELPAAIPQVVVADPLAALASYANAWRRQFAIPVVGITGSNGKTTTKELTGAILAELGPCHVTRGNLNNHIGVPLTLLEIEARHTTAVIEMGANHVGEIAHLAALTEPTVGLVTNAGAAHLEGFGDLDGVARGKGELFEALGDQGIAVLNADDVFAGYWRTCTGAARIVTFGLDSPAEFAARDVHSEAATHGFATRFDLVTPIGDVGIELRLAGLHNVRNALAAAAAAWAAGADLPAIRRGLAQSRAVSGRLELKPALAGAALIDDSYNANPNSVRAGLDALVALPGEHWLVLGEMAELGADAAGMHAAIGEHARATGVTRLYAVGQLARAAVEAFGAGAEWFASVDTLTEVLRGELRQGITVLIKGSRVNRLERVARAIAVDDARMAPAGHH